MIVEVDDDFSDQIVVNVLADSYVSMESMLKNKQVWHEDDLASYDEMMPAIILVLSWFSTNPKDELKKAKKRMKK
jgi:hypothetical protein